MLTWSPLHSTPPSHALSLEMHFSWVCAMSTRSLVKSCSHCTPVWNSRDSTYSSRMKSSGLRTEPWCTPTPTPNSPLYWPLTCTWLWTLEYMPWMTRTTHCSNPRLHKATGSSLPHNRRLSQSLWRQSRDEDGVSGTSTRHKAELHLIDVHHLTNVGLLSITSPWRRKAPTIPINPFHLTPPTCGIATKTNGMDRGSSHTSHSFEQVGVDHVTGGCTKTRKIFLILDLLECLIK